MTLIISFATGLIFGLGLIVGGMADPSKVLGFLDLAGLWDPSLACVMAGAILVALGGFAIARHQSRSFLGLPMMLPNARELDRRLILGSLLFGIGWGLVGLCPGPALANLAGLSPKVFGFVVAVAIGARAQDALRRIRGSQPQSA